MFWGNAYGNPRIHEEPKEPYRKGDRSTAMGHTRLQGTTRRERTLATSRRHEWASRIRTRAFLVVVLDTTAEEEESSQSW